MSRLDFPEGAVVMSGRFNPIDTDQNLGVDKLDQGEWTGIINNEIEFHGCFTACLDNACDGPPCQIMQR